MRLLSQRFYKFSTAFFILAGSWGILHLLNLIPAWFSLCLFKSFTGLPCPGCGTTRAGLAILHGSLIDAFLINPIGSLLLILLVIAGLFLVTDLISGKPRLRNFFELAEVRLKNRKLWVPLIVIILVNWGWSITKGL